MLTNYYDGILNKRELTYQALALDARVTDTVGGHQAIFPVVAAAAFRTSTVNVSLHASAAPIVACRRLQ